MLQFLHSLGPWSEGVLEYQLAGEYCGEGGNVLSGDDGGGEGSRVAGPSGADVAALQEEETRLVVIGEVAEAVAG